MGVRDWCSVRSAATAGTGTGTWVWKSSSSQNTFIAELCRAHRVRREAVAIRGCCLGLWLTLGIAPLCTSRIMSRSGHYICAWGTWSFKAVEFKKACGLGKESVVSRRATPCGLLYGTAYPLFLIIVRKYNSSGPRVTAGFHCSCWVKRIVREGPKSCALLLQFTECSSVLNTFMTNSKQILVWESSPDAGVYKPFYLF